MRVKRKKKSFMQPNEMSWEEKFIFADDELKSLSFNKKERYLSKKKRERKKNSKMTSGNLGKKIYNSTRFRLSEKQKKRKKNSAMR